MRYLFLSLPLSGHVNPISAVAAALAERGQDVAWVGSESFLRPVLGPDATVFPMGLRLHRGQSDRGMAATRSRWAGYVVPHARYALKAVDEAVTAYRPDVLVVDQHAVAGALVAHRHGLPWASLAPTSMELTRPYRAVPRVEAWIQQLLAGLWTTAGLPGAPPHDLRFSPHLSIAFTAPVLTGTVDAPGPVAYVGAVLGARPGRPDFPWRVLDPGRRHVLVTMGTLAMDISAGFYRRIVDALRPLDDVQAIVVAPDGIVTDAGPHVVSLPRVPVLDLLPQLDAVVSHGGLNTVCESLAHGVPLVIAPVKDDQPINAAQVVAAGAGVRVSFDRSPADALRVAVRRALDDPGLRAGAGRVRDAFAAAGGAPAAAAHLDQHFRTPARPSPTESEIR